MPDVLWVSWPGGTFVNGKRVGPPSAPTAIKDKQRFPHGRQHPNAVLDGLVTLIAAITLVLFFLLIGSAVLPVKVLAMNVLSLTAAFGALVGVFQQGHLGGLGTPATGTLGVELPVLLFCIAFGLSMESPGYGSAGWLPTPKRRGRRRTTRALRSAWPTPPGSSRPRH